MFILAKLVPTWRRRNDGREIIKEKREKRICQCEKIAKHPNIYFISQK